MSASFTGRDSFVAQASPLDCKGVGCCCNRQAGGNWPDCAKGYECRGQNGPPYAQVCVKKGASPLTVLSIRPNQPARCEMPADARRETEPETAGTGCSGAGCCCNQQAGGAWPDCAKGFECRRQTGPPHIQVCVKKGTHANAPLQLLPSEPAKCVLSTARRSPDKRHKAPEARGGASDEHPVCARMFDPRNRQLCNEIDRGGKAACKREHKGAKLRQCLGKADGLVKSLASMNEGCGRKQWCHTRFGETLEIMARRFR